MKKVFFALTLIVMVTASVFAGPHGCPGGGCRPCPPPPCPGWGGCGWRGGCDRGLGNAAAITSIVASGISILGNLSYQRTVGAAPAYAAPVVPATTVAPAGQPVVPAAAVVPAMTVAPAGQPVVPAYTTPVVPVCPVAIPGAGLYPTTIGGPCIVITDPYYQTPACKGYYPLLY